LEKRPGSEKKNNVKNVANWRKTGVHLKGGGPVRGTITWTNVLQERGVKGLRDTKRKVSPLGKSPRGEKEILKGGWFVRKHTKKNQTPQKNQKKS